MPLFECSKCHAVENTALGSYWYPASHGLPVLCSECLDGSWHDRFEKVYANDGNWEPDEPLRPHFLRRVKASG